MSHKDSLLKSVPYIAGFLKIIWIRLLRSLGHLCCPNLRILLATFLLRDSRKLQWMRSGWVERTVVSRASFLTCRQSHGPLVFSGHVVEKDKFWCLALTHCRRGKYRHYSVLKKRIPKTVFGVKPTHKENQALCLYYLYIAFLVKQTFCLLFLLLVDKLSLKV